MLTHEIKEGQTVVRIKTNLHFCYLMNYLKGKIFMSLLVSINSIIIQFIKIIYYFYKHQRSKLLIRSLLKGKQKLYIEVGAGNKKGDNGWITIDLTKNCDIFWDLVKGLPFPDESIPKIYSSHFLEHLMVFSPSRHIKSVDAKKEFMYGNLSTPEVSYNGATSNYAMWLHSNSQIKGKERVMKMLKGYVNYTDTDFKITIAK